MRSESWRERGVGEAVCLCVWRWPSTLWAFERTLTCSELDRKRSEGLKYGRLGLDSRIGKVPWGRK